MRKFLLSFFTLALCVGSVDAQTQQVSVVEYCPAPGQFVNLLPEVEEGMTKEQVLKECEEQLSKPGYLVHLGGYGGYITVKFDHPVENKKGSDLLIKGNGMYAADDPKYGKETIGGSIEPGIVFVGVGETPETAMWYELAGSEYFTQEWHKNEITYYRPTAESGSAATPGSMCDMYIKHEILTERRDIPGEWFGATAWYPKMAAHKQTYWPLWETADELKFTGPRVPGNAVEYTVNGNPYWVQYRYSADAYGYVDACPANDELYSSFDIDWAVDDNGKPVALDHVDFVRVMSGVLNCCGLLGETSTEIDKFEDLHLRQGYDDNPYIITPRPNPNDPTGIVVPNISSKNGENNAYYTVTGQRVETLVRGQIYICKGKKVMY